MKEHDLTPDEEDRGRAATEERRASPRLPGGLSTPVHPIRPDGGPAERARVHDISSYGLGLVMSRRLEYGESLIVDLENATRGVVHSVLARVVHSTSFADGGWLIGCALVGELDDDGLKAFEAGRVRPASSDCRAWVRFPCDVETVCDTVESVAGEQIPARIVNVSPGGLGLMLPCQFDSRTLLSLQLPSVPGRNRTRVLVRVVQARSHAAGHWYLGCEFVDRLSEGEIAALTQ